MNDIAISTASFCLWDIGPERKMSICKKLGFKRIVIAFSTLKMLRHFAGSSKLCAQLSEFDHVMVHAPWCGVTYKENRTTEEVFTLLGQIMDVVQVEACIFHFDCIKDWTPFKNCSFPYYVKNPGHASWSTFDHAKHTHDFDSVLDINKATRFENYLDAYLSQHKNHIKSIHVSGFVADLGRMPLVESGQVDILKKIRHVQVPLVIEGLFSPGDFQGIRDEVEGIKSTLLGTA